VRINKTMDAASWAGAIKTAVSFFFGAIQSVIQTADRAFYASVDAKETLGEGVQEKAIDVAKGVANAALDVGRSGADVLKSVASSAAEATGFAGGASLRGSDTFNALARGVDEWMAYASSVLPVPAAARLTIAVLYAMSMGAYVFSSGYYTEFASKVGAFVAAHTPRGATSLVTFASRFVKFLFHLIGGLAVASVFGVRNWLALAFAFTSAIVSSVFTTSKPPEEVSKMAHTAAVRAVESVTRRASSKRMTGAAMVRRERARSRALRTRRPSRRKRRRSR